MSFLNEIHERLATMGTEPVLAEMRDGEIVETSAKALLALIVQVRCAVRKFGVNPGERCVLLAANSVQRIIVDLALMAEGAIVVPLYARQAAAELTAMIDDCTPVAIVCGYDGLRNALQTEFAKSRSGSGMQPRIVTLEEIFDTVPGSASDSTGAGVEPLARADDEPVTIIYTSGTSGAAKGVVLTAGNIGFMLGCTSARLDILMRIKRRRDRVFHYLPLNFAGSWIMMLTCLRRGSLLVLNTDLANLAHDMPKAGSDYFLNVPQLLDRIRKNVDEQMAKRGGLARKAYVRGREAWLRQRAKQGDIADFLWVSLTQYIVFPMIRRTLFSNSLRALICGSAPLNEDTQLYFEMLGVTVLQVYGLTETTAICTMDDPRSLVPGRVGPAVDGIEMKLGANEEILVRGPNIFPEYWNRPEETGKVLKATDDGEWFHSGDQGEVDRRGNWKIIGRLKNLIILGSGHNVAPEPIEERVLAALPGATHAVLVGNGRSYLSVLLASEASEETITRALDAVNAEMPHYRQIRRHCVIGKPFSIENGLLTANGKLKRDAISSAYAAEIDAMYMAQMNETVGVGKGSA